MADTAQYSVIIYLWYSPRGIGLARKQWMDESTVLTHTMSTPHNHLQDVLLWCLCFWADIGLEGEGGGQFFVEGSKVSTNFMLVQPENKKYNV